MVESKEVLDDEQDQGEEKTFLEQPDILDKIKAASAITDGMYTSYTHFAMNSRPCQGQRTRCSRRRYLQSLQRD